MALESNITWTNIISLIALGVAVIVLVVSIYFNRKSLNTSTDVLNVSRQQIKQLEYFQVWCVTILQFNEGSNRFARKFKPRC